MRGVRHTLRLGIDTRMLTRIIRDEGTQRVIVVDASMPQEEALRRLKEAPVRRDMVERVSCRKRWFSRTANHRFDVVAVDCGIKHNIIRKLNEKGCNVTVVPYDITAEEVMAFRPDGLSSRTVPAIRPTCSRSSRWSARFGGACRSSVSAWDTR